MRRALRYTDIDSSVMELSIDFGYIGAMYLIKGMRGDEKDVYICRVETKSGNVKDIPFGTDKVKATEEFNKVEQLWLRNRFMAKYGYGAISCSD